MAFLSRGICMKWHFFPFWVCTNFRVLATTATSVGELGLARHYMKETSKSLSPIIVIPAMVGSHRVSSASLAASTIP